MGNHPTLAKLMSAEPEMLILGRFTRLNLENLLYLQAEIACLEEELRRLRVKMYGQGYEESLIQQTFLKKWRDRALRTAQDPSPTEEPCDEEWSLFLKIRDRLERYNTAVQQYLQTARIARPNSRDLRVLREWLDHETGYGHRFVLGQPDGIWDEERSKNDDKNADNINDEYMEVDYIALHNESYGFRGSHIVTFLEKVKRCLTARKKPPHQIYSVGESTKRYIFDGIITVIASIFPVLPILIFYFLESTLIRVILVLVFTALFAATMTFGMQLKADRVLAVTMG